MNDTQIKFSFKRRGGVEDYEIRNESFKHNFNISEDNFPLSALMEKFELLLNALGFVIDGKQLQLVDIVIDNPTVVIDKFNKSSFRVVDSGDE